MYHRPESPYGENIFMGVGMDSVDASKPVQAWYDEIKLYDFQKPVFDPKIGHFTQLVWKNSKKLGVAIAQKEKTIIVVANYDPPGNIKNRYDSNVLPPK
uniref:SCP domain-containing protein n=1 Tax=Megaselia scalaris TaxID=36166 RepID=T1GJX7_MEGSC